MENKIRNKAETFAHLPAIHEQDLVHAIKMARNLASDVIIVLDDDPTGTQTVYDVPVLTNWSLASILKEMSLGTSLFYILTNSRSLTGDEANQLALTIGERIKQAIQISGKSCMIISRSDSTLRGHYPSEVMALEAGLGHEQFVHILIPAFFEGGRYTIEDIHFVSQGDELIPAAQTPYAKDRAFGYQHSNLKNWVQEKTAGRILASEVIAISIEELRTQDTATIVQKLNQCHPGDVCIVNAAAYADLKAFGLALLKSNIQVLCRTAASFVAVMHTLPTKSLLTREELVRDSPYGGLVVVGSYVPKSTLQLNHLLNHTTVQAIELELPLLLGAPNKEQWLLQKYSQQINDLLIQGEDVVLFTSRALISQESIEENLRIGMKVSGFITTIIAQLEIQPRFLIAKGGVTSSDIATQSLGVQRAVVLGQVLPGIPVWRLGSESKYPGLPYIIFPGNVGSEDAITQVIQLLGKPEV